MPYQTVSHWLELMEKCVARITTIAQEYTPKTRELKAKYSAINRYHKQCMMLSKPFLGENGLDRDDNYAILELLSNISNIILTTETRGRDYKFLSNVKKLKQSFRACRLLILCGKNLKDQQKGTSSSKDAYGSYGVYGRFNHSRPKKSDYTELPDTAPTDTPMTTCRYK